MDTCDASWAGQKTTQLSGNLHSIGYNFLVVFHVFENSGPSREIYMDFDSVTTVNEGSTIFPIYKSLTHNATKSDIRRHETT